MSPNHPVCVLKLDGLDEIDFVAKKKTHEALSTVLLLNVCASLNLRNLEAEQCQYGREKFLNFSDF